MRRQAELLCKINTRTEQTIPLLHKCMALTGMGFLNSRKPFLPFFKCSAGASGISRQGCDGFGSSGNLLVDRSWTP